MNNDTPFTARPSSHAQEARGSACVRDSDRSSRKVVHVSLIAIAAAGSAGAVVVTRKMTRVVVLCAIVYF
jgi:hypothetical protein